RLRVPLRELQPVRHGPGEDTRLRDRRLHHVRDGPLCRPALCAVADADRRKSATLVLRGCRGRPTTNVGGTPRRGRPAGDLARSECHRTTESDTGSDPQSHRHRVSSQPAPLALAVSSDEDLSPKKEARLRARERKARPAKMVVDNAGVKRIQLALRDRATSRKTKKPKRES